MQEFPLPIYDGDRTFLGKKDLVISFYAQRCQFECSFCNLPEASHDEPLSVEQIERQIDWVFDKYANNLDKFRQLSVGNEGSILDRQRFPKDAMEYLLQNASEKLPYLEVLSLETRPEYINREKIIETLQMTNAKKIDVTVGFESQDDYIREVILKKNMKKNIFEKKVKLLGELGIRLTSYVLLKPSPTMSEEDGIEEAKATIEYLYKICQKYNTEIIIYLNPVYVAKGSALAKEFALHKYKPPKIESVLKVIAQTRDLNNIPIYTGLWSENNAETYGDYTYTPNFKLKIKEGIKQFNKTQDFTSLSHFLN